MIVVELQEAKRVIADLRVPEQHQDSFEYVAGFATALFLARNVLSIIRGYDLNALENKIKDEE